MKQRSGEQPGMQNFRMKMNGPTKELSYSRQSILSLDLFCQHPLSSELLQIDTQIKTESMDKNLRTSRVASSTEIDVETSANFQHLEWFETAKKSRSPNEAATQTKNTILKKE